ncbi:MAG: ABC transporter permease [Pseudomonadota bacterium]
MTQFLLKRLLFSSVTFFVIVTAVFFLLRAAPGGPFDGERQLTPEIEANLKAAYNLDDPLIVQYGSYWMGLVKGDLGPSFKQKDFRVSDLIAAGLPISVVLGTGAFLLALAIGLPIGIFAGMHPQSLLDDAVMALNNFNLSVPSIVAAPVMVLIFSVLLGLFPAGGADSSLHYVLPVIALAMPFSASVARLVRGGVRDVLVEPHIKTARSKGLSNSRVVVRHVLPIALIPLVSYLAPAAAALLTGSVVVETVFDLPGIGRYFVDGAINRDYTLVMGVTVVYSFAILMFNLLADLCYGLLDPRIRVVD